MSIDPRATSTMCLVAVPVASTVISKSFWPRFTRVANVVMTRYIDEPGAIVDHLDLPLLRLGRHRDRGRQQAGNGQYAATLQHL